MIVTAGRLAEAIGAEVHGDSNLELTGIARIEEASSTEVSFLANPKYRKYLDKSLAGAIILAEVPDEGTATWLVAPEPYIAFVKALRVFYPELQSAETGIHQTAIVEESAIIDSTASIGPFVRVEAGAKIGAGTIIGSHSAIGPEVVIGDGCEFYSHVTIRERCIIGNNVIIQNSVVIGGDGFGFAPSEKSYMKVPQVGNVVIEDDVEIGASTTIDRATLGETRIRKGVKLDNLIQIAHNVDIGENTVIAAQTGVSGSTKIGSNCMIGGQVGVAGHITIGNQVMIAAKTGVSGNVKDGAVMAGYPQREIHAWRRVEASLTRLPDLLKRFRLLEKKFSDEA